MAKLPTGRFTPKTADRAKADLGKLKDSVKGASKDGAEKATAHVANGRYTPPQPRKVALAEDTKPWVPYVMFGLFGLGLLAIVLNYMSLLPNSPTNWYLLGGLVGITGGFMVATQLK